MFSKLKQLRFIIMGLLAAGMVAWMAWDYISTPPAPIVDNTWQAPLPDTVQPTSFTNEQSESESHSDRQEANWDTVAYVDMAPPGDGDEVVTQTQPTQMVPAIPVQTFVLSDKAQAVLDELEETYLHQVKKARLDAQHQATESEKKLSSLTTPIEPVKANTPQHLPLLERLKVKSIVQTANRVTAWVEATEGQARPIKVGAYVGNARATAITKEYVQFTTADGKRITKYVESAVMPTSVEESHGKRR
ncbi:hypothetical protein [Vibrio jasicida]|uniref:hypothetical protein n=1 Tax=Vibrio jasicida TaxID=766224 RepID=UPI0005EFC8E3|nr:hypothetical protein [Vibrio jasicida]